MYKDNILSRYETLAKSQKRIADFVLDEHNLMHLLWMTVTDLAISAETTPATVVRTVHRFGYSGYERFKADMREYIMNHYELIKKVEPRQC